MIESLSEYILNDGEILSLSIEYTNKINLHLDFPIVIIDLKVRISRPKDKWRNCVLRLKFSDLIEFNLFEDFESGNNYSDLTLIQTENNDYYFSLDPFDNKNEQNKKDNFVIKARKLDFKEI
jgi:hypothetical protein